MLANFLEYYLFQAGVLYSGASDYLCQEKGHEREDVYHYMHLNYDGIIPEVQYPICSQERLLYIGNAGGQRKALATPLFSRNKAFFVNDYA